MAKTTKTTTKTTEPDIIYPLAFLYNYNEFRYSLRSLKNLPHNRVFVAGYAPDWLANANYLMVEKPLDMDRKNHEVANIHAVLKNIKATLDNQEISDDFILMNDDFYILKPLKQLPSLNRGKLDDVIEEYRAQGAKAYLKTMERTRDLLLSLGYTDLISYELHTPMLMNKQKWLAMYQLVEDNPELRPLHTRTLYGNIYKVGGTAIPDVKVYDYETGIAPGATFLSTENVVFDLGKVGKELKARFPEPSKYELE